MLVDRSQLTTRLMSGLSVPMPMASVAMRETYLHQVKLEEPGAKFLPVIFSQLAMTRTITSYSRRSAPASSSSATQHIRPPLRRSSACICVIRSTTFFNLGGQATLHVCCRLVVHVSCRGVTLDTFFVCDQMTNPCLPRRSVFSPVLHPAVSDSVLSEGGSSLERLRYRLVAKLGKSRRVHAQHPVASPSDTAIA